MNKRSASISADTGASVEEGIIASRKVISTTGMETASATPHCPECGSPLVEGVTCQDHFHQMLFWEAENPALGIVHHLMVLCYHLQHPSLYSPDGLTLSIRLLDEFVSQGITPQEVRRRKHKALDSGRRAYTITARPDSRGSYSHPVIWSMVAADVVAAGKDRYCDSVRAWARSAYEALSASGNLTEHQTGGQG